MGIHIPSADLQWVESVEPRVMRDGIGKCGWGVREARVRGSSIGKWDRGGAR